MVEQAPGSGRFSRRPLRGTDGFMFNTNDAAGSNGQDEHAGLAYSMERWTSFTNAAPRTEQSIKRIIWLSGPANKDRGETRECPREFLSRLAPE